MNVYFDNSATTKPYDEVIEAVSKGMKEYFGNPSSLHKIGMNCEKRLNEAREYFASTIKCNKEEIYFTSGGEEFLLTLEVCFQSRQKETLSESAWTTESHD